MNHLSVFILFLTPHLFGACHCIVSRSTCQDVAISNLVFIGTVEAIQPDALDAWRPNGHRNWLNDPEIITLRKNESESGVKLLKERYLQILSDLPEQEKIHLQAARTQEQLQTVMAWILGQGTLVRFKVRTVFQNKDDSDSDTDKKVGGKDDREDTSTPKYFEVWNDLGDCGVAFQKGETYLVYATDDEETDRLETNNCQRTARLSDAGEDLSYLYFFKNGGSKPARLEGFITSDIDQLQRDRFHYTPGIKSPVSDVIVQLHFPDGSARYAESDRNGRFVFDGLNGGDYQISVFEAGFPNRVRRLSGPLPITVRSGECATRTVLVLTRGLEH